MHFDPATVQAASDLLKQVGFPVAVALWFMWRTDGRLEDMAAAFNALTVAIGGKPAQLRFGKKKKAQED